MPRFLSQREVQTSMRVDASSMLIISSARVPSVQQQRPGYQQSLELAAAELVRYLFRTWLDQCHGRKAASTLSSHSERAISGNTRSDEREDTVGLEDRVVRAEAGPGNALDCR